MRNSLSAELMRLSDQLRLANQIYSVLELRPVFSVPVTRLRNTDLGVPAVGDLWPFAIQSILIRLGLFSCGRYRDIEAAAIRQLIWFFLGASIVDACRSKRVVKVPLVDPS